MSEISNRTKLLLGEEAMQKISTIRVIVFGVGGVGSWCAESLVRSGVSHLTIVDGDCVSETNINRQLMATTKTVGRVKVEVMKERLLEINPEAEIVALHKVYTKETNDEFELGSYDFVIDCIDSLKDKIQLLLNATEYERPTVLSSMGAALKVDPTQIKVAEYWKVRGCPLGAIMRKRMKQNKWKPAKKIMCVYSEEVLENKGKTGETCDYKAVINGSLVHITAVFGFMLAGLVIKSVLPQSAE